MDRKNEITEQLTDYLTGLGRGNEQQLAEVAAYGEWKARAKAELDRRMTRIMEMLPAEIVAAIAEGDVDMSEVARKMLSA